MKPVSTCEHFSSDIAVPAVTVAPLKDCRPYIAIMPEDSKSATVAPRHELLLAERQEIARNIRPQIMSRRDLSLTDRAVKLRATRSI